MATPRFLGPNNGFIPQATGQVIAFMRDPKEFKLNEYVQYLQTDKPVAVYYRLQIDDLIRMPGDNFFVWADGADRPEGDWNQVRFEEIEFSCKRRNYPFRVGWVALETAKNSWKPLEVHTQRVMQQAMQNRTKRVMDLLQNSANWGTHVDTANSLNDGAGTWDLASDDPSDPQYNAIKKSLTRAAQIINLDTNAVVKPEDLVLVISPECARAMANSPEMHNYLREGPFSKSQLEGGENMNSRYGLPPSLYGFKIIIEDSMVITSNPAAADTGVTSGTRSRIKDDDSALLLSRKGGINGVNGAPSFSTVQLYFYELEAAVETFDDPKNKRQEGHVVDYFAEVLAAAPAGYLIENVL